MDATASLGSIDVDSKLYNLIVNIEESNFPSAIKQKKNTVIKFTKIPDFDLDSKGRWPHSSMVRNPRLRRITAVDDQVTRSSRSLHTETVPMQISSRTRRKIATISEDDDSLSLRRCDKSLRSYSDQKTTSRINDRDVFVDSVTKRSRVKLGDQDDNRQKYSYIQGKESSKSTTVHRGVQAEDKQPRRLRNNSLYNRESKASAKLSHVDSVRVAEPRAALTSKSFTSERNPPAGGANADRLRRRSYRGSDTARSSSSNLIQKTNSISSDVTFENKSIGNQCKKNMLDKDNKSMCRKKDRIKSSESTPKAFRPDDKIAPKPQSRFTFSRHSVKPIKEIPSPRISNNSVNRDPIDQSHPKKPSPAVEDKMTDCGTQFIPNCTDVQVGTVPVETSDQPTDMVGFHDVDRIHSNATECNLSRAELQVAELETKASMTAFETLNIPNVSLMKDKSQPKYLVQTVSLPNLRLPALKISPHRDEDKLGGGSYIIGRATLTYTTRQKINIHVVGNDEPLKAGAVTSSYPLSVVSLYKKEVKNRDSKDAVSRLPSHKAIKSDMDDVQRPSNCSYLVNRDKLVKPSDILGVCAGAGGVTANTQLLDSDFLSEQFQRELNFIDSFFESLQYLESCSLSEKSLTLNKSEAWLSNNLELDNSDYNSFLSNLEHDDSYTMASKSLCLLNLLIRDEQRRARNLLFVLKMRENALKDFTKSQILWLENKKKLDNTDISTLKKKQRGALLKLQHECGEMQRMRKALLALSEKRKAALIKTKKNIELKLTSNVDVERIISDKKKLRRNYSTDRVNVPLKCFELSSSGCEELAIRPQRTDPVQSIPETVQKIEASTSTEKCIQTSDNLTIETVSTQTTAENHVSVDGGYLNILFQDLKMPQIFSSGKQYEVNEEALRDVLNSASTVNTLDESEVIERLISETRSGESTSPSTARSLVDELDQYYKGLNEDSSQDDVTDQGDAVLRDDDSFVDAQSRHALEDVTEAGRDVKPEAAAGPLPVPAGAAADPSDELMKTANTSSVNSATDILDRSVHDTSSVDVEAERLRRQQIAIEREIKALEQQQLLVVREIPDKPPPPYTPPAPRAPRPFRLDDVTERLVAERVRGDGPPRDDTADAFDAYIRDFCDELLDKQKEGGSELPWEACSPLPKRSSTDLETAVKDTTEELASVFTAVPPVCVTGLGNRRSDHIDEILFAEWRRREPEWTALHLDEALVKNQLFENIFNKILSDTIGEYKRTVVGLED